MSAQPPAPQKPAPSPPPATSPAVLSGRERDVLALIAAGMSNDEIAATMYVSINTVKTYIRTAYRKIGAARRSQAVVWAVRHGLLAIPGVTITVDEAAGGHLPAPAARLG